MTTAAFPTEVHERPPQPELFGQEQLERHAERLAAGHRLEREVVRGRPLLPHVEQSARQLDTVYRRLSAAPRPPQAVPSEDWLRDNYHVVLDQVRAIRQDLPRKYYFELPKLADGPFAGYPRVFVVARDLVIHTAGRFDLQTLVGYVVAYQKGAPLSIGEIWAIAIMLRVALVDELRRLADDVLAASEERQEARRWGVMFAEAPSEPAKVIEASLKAATKKTGRLSAAFVVELLQWLRDQPSTSAPAWLALQRALDQQSDSADEMLRREHQREAANQLAIGNIITTMRLLSSIDWPQFFERVSLVEQILREDPAQAYERMDFPTRDRYRHSVEELARGAKQAERAVARRAVQLAQEARWKHPGLDRQHHVGYYLISRGRFRLETELGYPPTVRERFSRFFFQYPSIGYPGSLAVATALVMASILSYAARQGASAGELWLVAIFTLLPVAELTVGLVNLLVTTQVRPRPLPKLDFRTGIPAANRTMVVVPAIVGTDARVLELLDDLEVRYFGNRDPHLHFALLTDFDDADTQTQAGDEVVLAAARAGIDRLNATHGADRFFLFHRERRWNDQERCWMGWERKRGKLQEFNHLLRGAAHTSFVVQHGDVSVLPSIRYVITLDSDTQLPMEAARALVGALSHPLNRPRFDEGLQRVTEGYGVLQPRIAVGVVSAHRTTFSRVFSGHVGIDPYTTAVSDLYQDVFGEGSYVGKGIYDVDAFEAALAARVPPNTLLSHDLFEGLYARAALVTDIDLVDDYPAHYLAFAARQHRWVRGDWQIARWLWRTVPDTDGRAVRNRLPFISRWKIFDNLRRSMVPPSLLLLLAAGWTVLPASPVFWTLLALLVLAFPSYTQLGRSITSRVAGVPLREHLRAERQNIVIGFYQGAFSVIVLAHQSLVMADAIARVIVRMLVTRRHLLQWVTADRATVPTTVTGVTRRMWPAVVLALVVAAMVLASRPDLRTLLVAAPILVLWVLSPALAHASGQPLSHRLASLSRAQRGELRRAARKTWRFFEDFLGPADNWLIPDNFQENRPERIAHRTSPTNIGLQLLATLSAYDFGYLSGAGVLDRLEPTFDSLLRMQRYRGHFYNWYDTRTLAALHPAYISTVDSGNLAGYLLTLRTGLAELTESRPIIDQSVFEGLGDVLELFEASLSGVTIDVATGRLHQQVRELREAIARRPRGIEAWRTALADLRDRLSSVAVVVHEIEEPSLTTGSSEERQTAFGDAAYWLEKAECVIAARYAELDALTGWMSVLDPGLARELPTTTPALAELVVWCTGTLERLASRPHSETLKGMIESARARAEELIERADRIGVLSDDLLEEIEFDFLFNAERQLFSIGYNVTDGRLDNSYYDLLASEARLASFMAIATGKISHEHWFKLGRPLAPSGSARALLSWSASMFEYLMPLLVMRTHPGTLLDETYEAVLGRQIAYAASRGVPWGISESAYNVQDLEGNYQYRAFGVPGLGLKRGLAEDLVVAPYATVLAAHLAPAEVVRNLQRLKDEGLAGRYGFCEAIDYTPERVPANQKGGVPLPTYMAHHQGMSLLALDNVLNGAPMQNRFHADARVQAAELLLYERIPQLVPLKNPPVEMAEHVPSARMAVAPAVRQYLTPQTISPRTHLLGNGSYSVMITNSGGGFSRRQDLAMTRWREDLTADDWGSFCYIRDVETGEFWSTTYQPVSVEADEYEVTFALDRAVFRRLDGSLETRTEIVVSPEDDVELRRVSITNHSSQARVLELTSYAEVVLASADADMAHPAFSNLFIETTFVPERDAIICARRPRTGGNRSYLVHVMSGRGRIGPATQFETDRSAFVGRGGTIRRPAALMRQQPLTNTAGAVLDPIVSLRHSIRLPPGGTARLTFTTGFAQSEADARRLIEKYYDRRAVARALALAGTHSQIELRHFGLSVDDAIRFQRLGGRLMYGDPRLRAAEAVHANRRGQAELWKYGISGDLPIVLACIAEASELTLFRDLLKAHEYLRVKGLVFDLVILNEHGEGYRQDLNDSLHQMLESSPERGWEDRAGGVFLRRADLMPVEDQTLLRAAARAVMDGAEGGLHQQLVRPHIQFEPLPADIPAMPATAAGAATTEASAGTASELAFFNGLGGFADGGREYVIHVDPSRSAIPPAPWSNVVAHESFGFAATEFSPGFTWSENSHDNRLTPWSNDPVRDTPGEALFLRDDEAGAIWSTTPLPAGEGQPYTVRHGQGYTIYEHTRDGIRSELRLFVPRGEAVKIFRASIRNTSSRGRRISATIYADWVLGEHRARTRLHVVTARDPATGALTATNAFRDVFGARVAFLDLHAPGGDAAASAPGTARTVTGDRTEFMGRNGTLQRPAALFRAGLSGRTGAALDPCGAVQIKMALEPGEERILIGQLGEANELAGARATVDRFRNPAEVDGAWDGVRALWNDVLGTIQVKTPEPSLDLLLNRWLLYQALACRIWGRSAFYQSSGAFGFRDQLQDSLALIFSRPHMVREQLLRAASRQFLEGDVQHWWHEPGGQGVRTRFSDDRLWLPYVALRYIAATGDDAVLDEHAPFLEGRILKPEEHEAYEHPNVSSQTGSLYEHCVRAIEISLPTGAHGLPLMGIGDWNDGMSLVGAGGQGESVWLGWFLTSILRPFADVAEARGEADRAARYREHATRLAGAIEQAWDGEWYRRAYFDDGTPLGSASNAECRIDAIAQSWSVLSGAGDPARARQAMASTNTHLVREADGLILLLTPPFDKMTPSPGYIQGYVPGVRENGGQYTHAALWTVLAFAALGDGDRAEELFRMINPINHGRTREHLARYRVEPYVVAADVYSQPPHAGRGGWTWYTGSAGWMYRVGIEGLLGITLERGALRVNPCIPRAWPGFEATVKVRRTGLEASDPGATASVDGGERAEYRIVVENPEGVNAGVVRVEVDGADRADALIPISDSGLHHVRVVMGATPTS